MTSETPIDPLESAEQHAGLQVPAAGAALPKRVVERLSLFLLGPQRAYNRGVIDAIRLLRADNEQLGERIALFDQRLSADSEAIARLAGLSAELRDLRAQSSEALTEGALTRGQVVDLAQALQRVEQLMAQLDTTPTDSARE
jgi:hypothetical protein